MQLKLIKKNQKALKNIPDIKNRAIQQIEFKYMLGTNSTIY